MQHDSKKVLQVSPAMRHHEYQFKMMISIVTYEAKHPDSLQKVIQIIVKCRRGILSSLSLGKGAIVSDWSLTCCLVHIGVQLVHVWLFQGQLL